MVDASKLRFWEGDPPSTPPPTGAWYLYFKADGLYIMDDAGTETQVSGNTSLDVDSLTTGQLFLEDGSELTIATGSVTVTKARHVIDTEGDASSDDLDTLAGMTAGEILLFAAANAARTVVVKNGADNIATTTGADITLDDTYKLCLAVSDGTTVTVAPLFGSGIEGTVGTTDNAVPRANGTGGDTLQASGVTIDDDDDVGGVRNLDVSGTATIATATISAGTATLSTATITTSINSAVFELNPGDQIQFIDGSDVLRGQLAFQTSPTDEYLFNAYGSGGGYLGSPLRFGLVSESIGFFSAVPTTRPTITGSRGGNAALANLLSALDTLGLINDNTTA